MSSKEKEVDDINTEDLLSHITAIETLSSELRELKSKYENKNKLISQYKEMFQFLLENQIKDDSFYTYVPGPIFINMERKECVNYVKTEIAKLTKESNDVKNNLQNKKKELVKIFNSMSEANYLDSDIYDYLIEDIQAKFTKKIKEESDEDEY